jgi:hypothetical protein
MSSGLGLTSGQLHDYQELYGPLAADLLVADRLRHMGTGGVVNEDSVITTCGTAYYCSTAGSTSVYVPNHGLIRATATGYYTIQPPDRGGLDLVIFTLGTTNQFFRVSSAGSGTTAITVLSGTNERNAVINNSSDAGAVIHLKSLSTSEWVLMNSSGSSGQGPVVVATSS